MKDYIIIGTGLSGLNTAQQIIENEWGTVQIIEKSRGVENNNFDFDIDAKGHRRKSFEDGSIGSSFCAPDR